MRCASEDPGFTFMYVGAVLLVLFIMVGFEACGKYTASNPPPLWDRSLPFIGFALFLVFELYGIYLTNHESKRSK